MEENVLRIGQRVTVKDKGDLCGSVAFVGSTNFAPGKWVGINLDEEKGKNNGTVQGKTYFVCEENHGMFVRTHNINIIEEDDVVSEPLSRSRGSLSRGSTPRSRLPLPGKGPTESRQQSFTDLKLSSKGKNTPSRVEREPSFIESNFVQTLKAPSSNERMESMFQSQQELLLIKSENKDLLEKLETLKIKRSKDLEKIKEYEKIRIQHDSLVEFKIRIMESHASVQRELTKARHEAKEAIEAKNLHAEEMLELSETVEMITLDKEMAEEKAETLAMELEAAKDKIEELTLDLDIIKTEMGGTENSENSVTHFEFKQLKVQNEKLRETLVRMRDLSVHEKNESVRYTKEIESLMAEKSDWLSSQQKYLIENEFLQKTISDLQEQVDAALGSEEMVDNLTVKCLDLEDRVTALEEEKEDLETLHEMNEELMENSRETEMELREEIERLSKRVRETLNERDGAYDVIHDHELTIQKFRDLVNSVQEQNNELRSSLEKETNRVSFVVPPERIDFGKMFAETKAHSRSIDNELKDLDVSQGISHVTLLLSFLSESFLSRGGDHEALLLHLLLPRLLFKINILFSQISEKFFEPQVFDLESLSKESFIERYSFRLEASHLLMSLTGILTQFQNAYNECDPSCFLRIGTLYPEMMGHEKILDGYIDLLRKNQFDENISLESLFRVYTYFLTLYNIYFESERYFWSLGTHSANSIALAIESFSTQIKIGQIFLSSSQESSEIGNEFKVLENDLSQMKTGLKSLKRRIPKSTSPMSSKSIILMSKCFDVTESCRKAIKCLRAFGKKTIVFATSGVDFDISSSKLHQILLESIEEVYEEESHGLITLFESIRSTKGFLTEMEKVILGEESETEVIKGKESPVSLRAQFYKSQLKETESLKNKCEAKESDIKELKRLVKIKCDEVSEMQVRKDISEKKLNDTSRDSELMIDKLRRQLEDANHLLKRKDKEFEETMDHLQADIESLESEKGELKDRVKNMSKKALFEGISKSQALTEDHYSKGPSIPSPIKDSPLLLQHVRDLTEALLTLKNSEYQRESLELKRRLEKLTPLILPKGQRKRNEEQENSAISEEKKDASKEDVPNLEDLRKKLNSYKHSLHSHLRTPVSVVDLSDGHRGRAKESYNSLLLSRRLKEKDLYSKSMQLQCDVSQCVAARTPGGEVIASFSNFPSRSMAKVLKKGDKELVLLGKISYTSSENSRTIPLLLNLSELQFIHQKIISI